MELSQFSEAVGNLEEDKVTELLKTFVESNPGLEEAQKVVSACQEGMEIVGKNFEDGEYFVGDLIYAGEILKNATDMLKPLIGGAHNENVGKVVVGTVKGDLHDIGKNIFISMAGAVGFEVHDLGIDQSSESFVEKIKEVDPQIVGMSGVLTLAIDAMKETVDAIKEANLRNNVKIIIGGNPVTKEACEYVGADTFTTNAQEGVKICKKWVIHE